MQHAIARAFVWASGLALLLAIAGGALIGSSFLRRIDTITRTSLAIMEGDLSARIPVRGTYDEIDQLVSSLNAMLSRIQQLMDRPAPGLERHRPRPAHAARPPAPAPRGCARAGDHHADYDARDRRRHRGGRRALGNLLRPAAHRPGRGRRAEARLRRSRPVRAGAQCRRGLPAGREDSEHTLDCQIEDGVKLAGDRQLLAQMITNLVENALRHTPAGSTVSVSLRRTAPPGFEIEVADNGPGIPEDEYGKVFDRFYRSTAGARLPAAASVSPW